MVGSINKIHKITNTKITAMEVFEKDWNIEKKVAMVIQLLKETSDRLNSAMINITDIFNFDDIIKSAKMKVTEGNIVAQEAQS